MARPPGPFPDFATDATYNDPGKTWNGAPTKVALTSTERAQGFKPDQEVPAPKLGSLLNAFSCWIAYLDGIEARNWGASVPLVTPTGAEGCGVGTSRDYVVPMYASPYVGGTIFGLSASTIQSGAWQGDGTGVGFTVFLDLPDETVITGVRLYLNPASGAALPDTLPKLGLSKKGLGQTNTGDLIFLIDDPTTPNSAYRLAHNFGVNGFFERVNRDLKQWSVIIEDEAGPTNNQAGLLWDNLVIEIRDTPAITLYDTPGVPGGLALGRRSIAYNPFTGVYYAIVVRDHVTTPIGSTDGLEWADIDPGFGSPTQSTVDLTFVLANAGDLLAGSKYSDGVHVWTLDADHLGLSAGTRGPYAATIYSPSGQAYYGPIEAPASSITQILEPKCTAAGLPVLTSVNNATDGTPGTDPLGGYSGSIAFEPVYGTAVAAFKGYANEFLGASSDTLVRISQAGVWTAISGDFDLTAHEILDVHYAPGIAIPATSATGAFLLPGRAFSGSRPRFFYNYALSTTGASGAHEETLPNAASHTVTKAFAAGSTTGIVYISHNGSTNTLWYAAVLGDAYTRVTSPGFTGVVTGLEWSDADLYFVLTTATGHVYRSTAGTVWEEPTGAAICDSIEHVAVMGSSWLIAGVKSGVNVLLWSGDKGVTWSLLSAPWPSDNGRLDSLVALLDGGFAGVWVGEDGSVKLYRSIKVP